METKRKFEFLDITTADVAFASYGHDLNELFVNSAAALFELMTDTSKVEPERKVDVEVDGHDMKSLMFNWLSELIFISSSEYMLFSKFKLELDEKKFKLTASCYGEEIDKERHELKADVKAATYHNMQIEKNGIWRAQVILDV